MRDRKGQQQALGDGDVRQKQDKELVVSESNAIVNPGTMVIHLIYVNESYYAQ